MLKSLLVLFSTLEKKSGIHIAMMRFMRRLMVLLISTLSFTSVMASTEPEPPKTAKILEVIAYQVHPEEIAQQIKFLGRLQANQSIFIQSKVTDTLKTIHFSDGQWVEKGQLLMTLNDREQQALLAENKVDIVETQRQYARVKEIAGRGNITQSTIDEKQSAWQSALAQQQVLESQLADRKIAAPFSGILGFSGLTVGSLITAETPLMSLDDIRTMKLDLYIPVRYLVDLAPEQKVIIESEAFPKQTFLGKVISIAPRVEEDLSLIQVRALINNPNLQLKTHMMVLAQINLPAKTQLRVPNSAVLMLGDKQFVYRLVLQTDGQYQAQKIAVRTGQIGELYTEITEGLQANDLVVSQGVMRVKPKELIHVKGLQNTEHQENLLKPSAMGLPTTKEVH